MIEWKRIRCKDIYNVFVLRLGSILTAINLIIILYCLHINNTENDFENGIQDKMLQ